MANDIDLSQVKWDAPQDSGIDLSQVKWDSQNGITGKPSIDMAGANRDQYLAESNAMNPFSTAIADTAKTAMRGLSPVFSPLSETFGGKSANETLINKVTQDYTPQQAEEYKQKWNQYPDFYKADMTNPFNQLGLQAKIYTNHALGNIADMAQTPANMIPLPVAEAIGKIPVGTTNVGRLASNVELRNPFSQVGREAMGKDVQSVQGMDDWLQNRNLLNSRGIEAGNYNPDVLAKATQQFVNVLNPNIGKFKTGGQVDKYTQDASNVLSKFGDHADELQFENSDTGQMENRLPSSRSEVAGGARQIMNRIWSKVNQSTDAATQQGAMIDYGKIGSSVIDPFLTNKAIQTHNEGLITQLQKLKDNIAARGQISPQEAQDELRYLNSQLDSFFKRGNAGDTDLATVRAAITARLRNETDSAIENALQKGGWKQDRQDYSSFKNLEGDMIKASAKQMKGVQNGSVDKVFDALSTGEAILGLATGNVKEAGRGIIYQLAKAGRNYWLNPDRKISGAIAKVANARISSNPSERRFVFGESGPQERFGSKAFDENGNRIVYGGEKNAEVMKSSIVPQQFQDILGLPSPRNVPYDSSQHTVMPSPSDVYKGGPIQASDQTMSALNRKLSMDEINKLNADDLGKHIDFRYEAKAPQSELNNLETILAKKQTEQGFLKGQGLTPNPFESQAKKLGAIALTGGLAAGTAGNAQAGQKFDMKGIAKNFNNSIDMTKYFEGFKPVVYQDTSKSKHNTIGYGFNMDEPSIRAMIPPDVLNGQHPRELTKLEANKIFQKIYPKAIVDAKNFVGKDVYNQLSNNRKAILVDMAYNMGADKLSGPNGFHHMRDALLKKDYKTAAKEMVNSDWYGEVGNRSKFLVNLMMQG